ncbi:hypothetical protein [Desulfallas thermosapovorans]|uniref:Uncharacterized protein n=1 Tax=Desulfallas thermosapovorans DSM 6562 TaxID=1121431 RepID=A0A5S4ZWA3_9FIRM|nr:hypothetical protein [Desulfallas thermosapovorans]TYO96496.1 hypothetical protein LX24_00964 [Desulfallas thermosapovorans DSM 6562]
MLQTLLFFAQGIPETAGVVACSLALARVKLRWGVILAFASALTMVIYVIRNMPVTFGLHTLAGILLSTLFIARFTRVPPFTSFIVVFAAYALLGLLELAVYELFGTLLNTEASLLMSNQHTRTLIGLPQGFILIAVAFITAKYRRAQEGMWRI